MGDALGRRREEDDAPRRCRPQVADDAQLDLLLSGELALGRLEADAHGLVQQVEAHLRAALRRHQVDGQVVVEEVIDDRRKDARRRHAQQMRHAVEVNHRAAQAERVPVDLVEEGLAGIDVPDGGDHVLGLRRRHAAVRREQIVEAEVDVGDRHARVDTRARQLVQHVRRELGRRRHDRLVQPLHLVRARLLGVVDDAQLPRPALQDAKARQHARAELAAARILAHQLRARERHAAESAHVLRVGLRLELAHVHALIARRRARATLEQAAHLAKPLAIGGVNRGAERLEGGCVELGLDRAIHAAVGHVAHRREAAHEVDGQLRVGPVHRVAQRAQQRDVDVRGDGAHVARRGDGRAQHDVLALDLLAHGGQQLTLATPPRAQRAASSHAVTHSRARVGPTRVA